MNRPLFQNFNIVNRRGNQMVTFSNQDKETRTPVIDLVNLGASPDEDGEDTRFAGFSEFEFPPDIAAIDEDEDYDDYLADDEDEDDDLDEDEEFEDDDLDDDLDDDFDDDDFEDDEEFEDEFDDDEDEEDEDDDDDFDDLDDDY